MRNFITQEWLTVFTILGLLAIAIAKYLNALRFSHYMWAVVNSKYLKIYAKDLKFTDSFSSLLFFNLCVSASVFLYLCYSIFILPKAFEIIPFLYLMLLVSGVVIIKILLERFIGYIFDITGVIDSYLFQKFSIINYMGFILCMANVLLLFTELHPKIITITSIVLIFLIYSIGCITSFKTHQKIIIPNFFYFLLYLCALEIAPYILLYKVVSGYNV